MKLYTQTREICCGGIFFTQKVPHFPPLTKSFPVQNQLAIAIILTRSVFASQNEFTFFQSRKTLRVEHQQGRKKPVLLFVVKSKQLGVARDSAIGKYRHFPKRKFILFCQRHGLSVSFGIFVLWPFFFFFFFAKSHWNVIN